MKPYPAGDDAFQFASRLDGTKTDGEWQNPGNVASVYDTARRSQAIKITGGTWAIHGKDYRGLGSSYYDYNASGARVLSVWTKSTSGPAFVVTVETTAGLRGLRYQWTGTPTAAPYAWTGESPNVPLFGCQLTPNGVWQRLERNLSADVAAAFPGETLIRARGMTFNAYTQDLYLDDVRLSNAMTVEHNTMGPGVIGHILRHTQTDPSTYAVAHRWFHYDQVGSVLSESDATGNLAQTHHQDAFGNTLASWQTGLVGGDRAGWHHNTKEWDGDVGLVYMYQRWYEPGAGVFVSSAMLPRHVESPYGFGIQNPMRYVDFDGKSPTPIGGIGFPIGAPIYDEAAGLICPPSEPPKPDMPSVGLPDLPAIIPPLIYTDDRPTATTLPNVPPAFRGDGVPPWDPIWVRPKYKDMMAVFAGEAATMKGISMANPATSIVTVPLAGFFTFCAGVTGIFSALFD